MKPFRLPARLRSNRLAGDTIGYTAAIVVSRLPPFLFLPFFASALPPAALGHYLTAVILADLVQTLSSLGMVQALFRFFAKAEARDDRRGLLGTAVCTGLAGAAGSCALFAAAYAFPPARESLEAFRSLPPSAFGLALLAGAFIGIYSILNACLWAERRSGAFLKALAFGAALETALSGLMVAAQAVTLERMLAVECVKDAAVAAAAAFAVRGDLVLRFDAARFRDLFRFGGWFMPMGLFSWMLLSTDRFWLGQAASMADVGVYGFFYKFASPAAVLFQGYIISLDSQLFRMRSEDAPGLVQAALRAYLRRAGALMALAALVLPAAVWFGIRARPWLPEAYLPGLKAYPVLLAVVFVYFWAGHYGALLDYRLRSRRQLELMACAAAANFLLCPLAIALAPRLGIDPMSAAAYANLAAVSIFLGLHAWIGEASAARAWRAAVPALAGLAILHVGWSFASRP